MVDEDIGIMYDQVMLYIEDKIKYVEDPTYISKEYNDFNAEFDLAELINLMQVRINRRPTLGEANLIKAYREIRSAEAEYALRLTSRSTYYLDSANEEFDNFNKWDFNKKIVNNGIKGVVEGA